MELDFIHRHRRHPPAGALFSDAPCALLRGCQLVVVAELHPADEGYTTTLSKTLTAAEAKLEAVDTAPTVVDPAEYASPTIEHHSRAVLKALDDSPRKTRISELKQNGFSCWRGDEAARRARTCTSDTCFTSPPQSLITEAPTHRRRHSAGGCSRRIWLYLRAH